MTMTTVTLDDIKAEQSRLAAMIAILEAQARVQTLVLPETTIALQPGERYAGIVLGHGDEPSHHVILLPGEAEDVTHTAAQEWAASIGGELPNRHEQALLYANLEDQFQNAWYWSDQQHESDPDYVWCQLFLNGYQPLPPPQQASRPSRPQIDHSVI